MPTYHIDKLPPWPRMPDGWDEAAIVPRRAAPLSIGAIVFVLTDTRVYARKPGALSSGGPIERYRYEPRMIGGETRASWLLTSWSGPFHPDRADKVPKRDLSKVFGLDDVEDALWICAHQYKIAGAVGALRCPDQARRAALEQIAQILGMPL
ncbi:hypothetical protein [Bradyrhizobium sp. USDA 4350]